jgi:hypothetical protein
VPIVGRTPRGRNVANQERAIGAPPAPLVSEAPDEAERAAWEHIAGCIERKEGIDAGVVASMLGTYRSKANQFIAHVTDEVRSRVAQNARMQGAGDLREAGLGALIEAIQKAPEGDEEDEEDETDQHSGDALTPDAVYQSYAPLTMRDY